MTITTCHTSLNNILSYNINKIRRMTFYKLIFSNNMKKLLHLQNVTSVSLNKKTLVVKYNVSKTRGMILFGSGSIESDLESEIFNFDTEVDADNNFENIYKIINKCK